MESMRIILCPGGTVTDSEHTLTHKTWFLTSTDCSVKGAHLQHVDNIATQKCIDRGQSSGHRCACHKQWYTCNCHKVPWGPSVGLVPMFVQYHASFSTAPIPQLQLWLFRDLHWQVLYINTACIPTYQFQPQYYTHWGLRVYHCAFHNSIRPALLCTLHPEYN